MLGLEIITQTDRFFVMPNLPVLSKAERVGIQKEPQRGDML
jgi:hypothetical protein